MILHVRQIIVDPGKCRHARNGIPGSRNSRNRIDDVTSGYPVLRAVLRVLCLPDTSPALAHPWSRPRMFTRTCSDNLSEISVGVDPTNLVLSANPPHPPRPACLLRYWWGECGLKKRFVYNKRKHVNYQSTELFRRLVRL